MNGSQAAGRSPILRSRKVPPEQSTVSKPGHSDRGQLKNRLGQQHRRSPNTGRRCHLQTGVTVGNGRNLQCVSSTRQSNDRAPKRDNDPHHRAGKVDYPLPKRSQARLRCIRWLSAVWCVSLDATVDPIRRNTVLNIGHVDVRDRKVVLRDCFKTMKMRHSL